jgi:hypothetical protein
MGFRLFALLTVSFLPFSAHAAGDQTLDRATLRGLKSIAIVIDRLDPELVRQGLTLLALQSRLENRLRDSAIPLDKDAGEFVGVRVIHVRGGRGPYALCLSVGLYQPVQLVRDRNLKTATQTWEVETVLMAEPKLLVGASLDSLDELADSFVAAWRSVNPR